MYTKPNLIKIDKFWKLIIKINLKYETEMQKIYTEQSLLCSRLFMNEKLILGLLNWQKYFK